MELPQTKTENAFCCTFDRLVFLWKSRNWKWLKLSRASVGSLPTRTSGSSHPHYRPRGSHEALVQKQGSSPSCLGSGGEAAVGKGSDPPECPGLAQETGARDGSGVSGLLSTQTCLWPTEALSPQTWCTVAASAFWRKHPQEPRTICFDAPAMKPCRPGWPEACPRIPASKRLGTQGRRGCEGGFVRLIRLALPSPC